MTALTTGTIVAVVALAALGLLVWKFWTAPVGYQAADGFHYGEPDQHADPDNWGAR